MNTFDVDDFSDIAYNIDFGSLYEIIEAVRYIGGFLLGVAAICIVMFMTLITVFDMAYITIPPFQSLARHKNWDGSQNMENVRFKLISRDAFNAVEETAMMLANGEYKSVVWRYVCKRVVTYLKANIVVCLLLIGSGPFVQLVRTWFEPLLNAFKIFL